MESEYIIKAFFALILVAGLIGIAAIMFQKFALEKNLLRKGQPKRLRTEEFLYLDAKRKLVLVKKDDEETLILLSHNSETIISTGKAPAGKAKKKSPAVSGKA